ncbi:MAG: hypothetical protein ACTSP6_11990, partial [Promethearchaeota archaeon]
EVEENSKNVEKKYNLIGEIYLDIDYSDIAYINDTGRNWNSTKSNLRDKVNSKIKTDFSSSQRLLNYLNNEPHPKLIFQIHPERWSDNYLEYIVQFLKDKSINFVKCLL